MTIKEVPTHILRESLLAIADLGRKYREEPQVTAYAARERETLEAYHCPLCMFQFENTGLYPWDVKPTKGISCTCPWFWIEGHMCQEYEDDIRGEVSYADFPIPDRLARIARWEEAINAELAGRAE